MGISDRYASAIRSSNLAVDERTTYSDTDVLGAMGKASIERPVGAALARLVYGDNAAIEGLIEILAERAWAKSHFFGARISRGEAKLITQACMAWHRDGTCKHCAGHGKLVIKGTKTLGDRDCEPCRGTGRIPLERQFSVEPVKQLARWVVSDLERELGQIMPEAHRMIGTRPV